MGSLPTTTEPVNGWAGVSVLACQMPQPVLSMSLSQQPYALT